MAPSHNTGDCLIRARKSDAIHCLRIQDENRFVHLPHSGDVAENSKHRVDCSRELGMSPVSGSVIILHFAIKSPVFMSLGACRLKRSILVLMVGLCASLSFISCGSTTKKGPPSGLKNRVLASQGVSSTFSFGSLVFVDGTNDTI